MPERQIFQVMLSSPFIGLTDHRREAIEALIRNRCFPNAMEHDSGRSDADIIDASLLKVDASDGYLCLLGKRYGQIRHCPVRNPDRLSLTELEFDRALKRGIPINAIVMNDAYATPDEFNEFDAELRSKLKGFRNKIASNNRVIEFFSTWEEFLRKIFPLIENLRKSMDQCLRDGDGAMPGTRIGGTVEWEAVTADPGGSDSGYNQAFYELLKRTLAGSRQLAVVAGEGFEMTASTRNDLARDYIRIMANCACRHTVYRIEFSEPSDNAEWIRSLATHVPFFDGRRGMRVYRPKPSLHLIRNLAIVDPHSQSSSEALLIMFPKQQALPLSKGIISRAQAAVATRHKATVSAFWSSIERLLSNSELFDHFDSADALLSGYGIDPGFLAPAKQPADTLYFAYGGNMLRSTMGARAPSAVFCGPARLENHELIFGMPEPVTLLGGVASVAAASDRFVEGALYRVNKHDLETRIGFFEGMIEDIYRLRQLTVQTDKGPVKAWAFVFSRNFERAAPGAAYINSIVDGARDIGASEVYVDGLRQLVARPV